MTEKYQVGDLVEIQSDYNVYNKEIGIIVSAPNFYLVYKVYLQVRGEFRNFAYSELERIK